ncbi:MAG: ATP-dependent helicase [Planctomycetaceae bacterium]|nr:MAG: ATP-dependent helicase [Planctomycetaceae bacterium]
MTAEFPQQPTSNTSSAEVSLQAESLLRSSGLMITDRWRLLRRTQQLRQQPSASWQNWFRDWEHARQRFELRRQLVPPIEYDGSLPIHAHRQILLDTLSQHQVVIVTGETGSGKSTQLPKFCLELGRGLSGLIGHTQPRRIAARTIAARLAQELKVPLGKQVGFQIRFNDTTTSDTLIKLMTDGILLAETHSDRYLNRYDTIILDEAHERSLNIDLLLGFFHRLLRRRRDLQLIVTSATLEARRLANYFAPIVGNVPVVEVSGRSYPVEIRYRPWDETSGEVDAELSDAILQALHEVASDGAGDVLVFLPTERDIHEMMNRLRGQSLGSERPVVLPLYARLAALDQQRVFQPTSARKIVLATNVAESSLTVPGIRYVIDTGLARISRYTPRCRLQRLPVEPISQASADQRAGRCGRVGPGVCIRLYSEEDYARRDRYTPPEIQRSNLAAVILRLAVLGWGQVADFPFLDPPRPEAVREGIQTLIELGALDEKQKLTALGRRLQQFPVDPRVARLIIAGEQENCLAEMLVLAAVLELQDPRERPLDRQEQADQVHALWTDPDSDFLSYLRIWKQYLMWKETLSRSQLRKACLQQYLSPLRMQEWFQLHRELAEIVWEWRNEHTRHRDRSGRPMIRTPIHLSDQQLQSLSSAVGEPTVTPERYAALHRALLTAFLHGVALQGERGEYQLVTGTLAQIWPGSTLAAHPSRWIVAAEQLETNRRYLRTCARIDPRWIERLASHLVHKTFSEPAWDSQQGCAWAEEKVWLYQLPIVPRRRVRYHRIDPQTSRLLLLRHGLLEGEWPDPPAFVQHNRQLIARCRERQHCLRQTPLLRAESDWLEFYEQRIPSHIVEGSSLKHWWQTLTPVEQQRLLMTESDVLRPEAPAVDSARYPSKWQQGELSLPLRYRYAPGQEDDGVTLTVPRHLLSQLRASLLEWLIPGWLPEKVEALLRTLPRERRHRLSPLDDTAHRITSQLQYAQGDLLQQICHIIQRTWHVELTTEDFAPSRIPPHLRLRIEIVDERGEVLAAGRDLVALQERWCAPLTASLGMHGVRWVRQHITTWDFGPLTEEVIIPRGEYQDVLFPTLEDLGDSVGLRLVAQREWALESLRGGLRRLFALAVGRPLGDMVAQIPGLQRWSLLAATCPQPFPLKDHVGLLIVDRSFLQQPWPRDAEAFQQRLQQKRSDLPRTVVEVMSLLREIFDAYNEVRRAWERTAFPVFQPIRQDIHSQLAELLRPGFLVETPWEWLQQYPRYLRAIVRRLDKLSDQGFARDQARLKQLRPYWSRYLLRRESHQRRNLWSPALEQYRWMVEEYRVWLFAQELGTCVRVSEKRLDQLWLTIE